MKLKRKISRTQGWDQSLLEVSDLTGFKNKINSRIQMDFLFYVPGKFRYFVVGQ